LWVATIRRYWAIEGKEAVEDLVRYEGVAEALVVSELIAIFHPGDGKS